LACSNFSEFFFVVVDEVYKTAFLLKILAVLSSSEESFIGEAYFLI
jgi:hypothetical protein